MAALRGCTFCGGRHRLKKAAKRCAITHGHLKKWSLAELGLSK